MRLLTKSRFKLGLECPNKLFYTKKGEYANSKQEDSFLEALAQGGFQVEELARMHFPGGILIEGNDGDYEQLWKKTKELLANENIIIYEAAFLNDGLFIRTDVLVKKGNRIDLIEVKAKSFDSTDPYIFVGKKGGLVSAWKPYLFDVAFQKNVIQACYPAWKIESFIMMADKTQTASIEGLNQLFRINKTADNRTGITKLIESIEQVGNSVLGKIKITDIVQDIENNKHRYHDSLSFQDSIKSFKEHYEKDKYYNWPTAYSACKSCEFKINPDDNDKQLKSGFKECFTNQHNWTDKDFERPSTFDVWSFLKGSKLFDEKIFFMSELSQEKIGYKEDSEKLSMSARQWLQIEKENNLDASFYVDKERLELTMNDWVYPLHFIDFETSAAALPFNKGRRPYEQIAFQFSHHIYHATGLIEHFSEYINNVPGFFPNFDFIRALKKTLSSDNGTIFRYAPHENTILNAIYDQLLKSNENDKIELMDFIKTISHSKTDSVEKWTGARDMVDLCEIIKMYYYNPLTKGSNSIKAVLPAVLASSRFLRNKYSNRLSEIKVTSKNFDSNHVWLQEEGDLVVNPYKLLPSVFQNWNEDEIESTLSGIDDIANGGAALTAYSRLQYTNMDGREREDISKALLKYCELDTLAMVMIFEHFKEDLIK